MLDGELVEREVVGGERERRRQLGRPGLRRLARARVDQVEGEAREGRARDLDRPERLLDIVQPAEEAKVRVVQRLDAERDAVDAGGAVAAEALRLDARRVGFERDLGVRRDRPVPGDRVEDAPTVAGSISDGVPPPRKMLDTVRPGRAVRRRRDLAGEGLRIARLVGRLVADMAVEVAIGAFGRAERPVDIDAEAGFRGRSSLPASPRRSAAKARARCGRCRVLLLRRHLAEGRRRARPARTSGRSRSRWSPRGGQTSVPVDLAAEGLAGAVGEGEAEHGDESAPGASPGVVAPSAASFSSTLRMARRNPWPAPPSAPSRCRARRRAHRRRGRNRRRAPAARRPSPPRPP